MVGADHELTAVMASVKQRYYRGQQFGMSGKEPHETPPFIFASQFAVLIGKENGGPNFQNPKSFVPTSNSPVFG